MFTSWSALESHQRALHTDYYHSLTNYISHNSLPGLITDCIHLYLITLLVSAYLYLVHSLAKLFMLLHCISKRFPWFYISWFLDFLPVWIWISCLLFCLWLLSVFVCLFVGLPTCVLTYCLYVYWIMCLDCPLIKAAIGSQPWCLRAVGDWYSEISATENIWPSCGNVWTHLFE